MHDVVLTQLSTDVKNVDTSGKLVPSFFVTEYGIHLHRQARHLLSLLAALKSKVVLSVRQNFQEINLMHRLVLSKRSPNIKKIQFAERFVPDCAVFLSNLMNVTGE